jgi:hypothetical protein
VTQLVLAITDREAAEDCADFLRGNFCTPTSDLDRGSVVIERNALERSFSLVVERDLHDVMRNAMRSAALAFLAGRAAAREK